MENNYPRNKQWTISVLKPTTVFRLLLAVFVTFFCNTVFAQTFTDNTSSGGSESWTVPTNVTSITIQAWGGGGAGGAADNNPNGGSGGGGGGYSSYTVAVTPGQLISYTVGAGGNGGTGNGGNGGATTILALTANGGGGGGQNQGTAGVLGTASGGTTNTNGTAGGTGITTLGAAGGFSNGLVGGASRNTYGNGNGAVNPGSGGGGGLRNCGGGCNGRTGGNGSSGQVVINYLTVSGVSPSPVCVGSTITITGTNFSATSTSVTVGGVACTSVNRVSATSITAVIAAGTPGGTQNVLITNTNGTNNGQNVTVNTLSTVPTGATGTTTICNGGSTALTVAGGSKGTGAVTQWYTGSCGVGTLIFTGDVLNTGALTTDTTYYVRYNGTCNTTSCATVSVTITPTVGTPTAITIASGTEPSCQLTNGTTTTTYATTATNSTGFNWSLSNPSAGSINSSGVMTWANGFSGSVDIQVTANGCSGPTSPAVVRTVIVNPRPTAFTVTGTGAYCSGGSGLAVGLSGSEIGVNYQLYNGVATVGSPVLGTGSAISFGSQTGTTTYTVTATNGTTLCTTTMTGSAVITETPTVGTPVFSLGATSTRCQGAGSVTYTATATNNTGLTYSLDAATLAFSGNSIVAGSGAVTYAAGWSGTSTITASATGCSGPATATHTVTITPTSAVGAVSTDQIICSGNSPSSDITIASATGTIQWQRADDSGFTMGLTNIGTNSTTLTAAQVGPLAATKYFRAVVTNGVCAAATSGIVTVTVNQASVAPTSISGTTTICNGTSTTLTVVGGVLGTGATVEWFTGSCGGTSAGTGNSITVSPLANTTYFVRYTGSCNTTTCTSVSVIVTPTVGNPTAITIANGSEPTCQLINGTTTTTYATTATDNTGFNWSLSNASAGSINSSGVMTWANGFSGTVDIRVTANGCYGPSAQVIRTVTIKTLPDNTVTNGFTGGSFCTGSQATLTFDADDTNGAPPYTLSYTDGTTVFSQTILTNAATTFNVAATTSTGYTLNSITNANGCINLSPTNKTANVFIRPNPTSTISGNAVVCQGAASPNIIFTNPRAAGITVTYTINGGANQTVNVAANSTTNVPVATTTAGSFVYDLVSVVYSTNPTCIQPLTGSVTVTVNPNSAVGTVSLDQTICTGSSLSSDITTASATGNIQWQRADNSGFTIGLTNVGTNSTTLTIAEVGVLTTTKYFRAVVTSGVCTAVTSGTVTVNVTPTVGTPTAITIASGTEPTCQLINGTTTTTYATTSTNNTGFNWSLSNLSAGSIDSATGVMTWANGFSGTVNILVTANGCNGPSSQVVRTVNITPTVGIPTAITISSGTEPNCQPTNGTTTTTYATTSTNNTGLNWSLSNPAAGNINSSGVMTWANGFSGSVNIQVTANGCNGPSTQVVRTILVNPLPAVAGTISGTAVVCQGQTNIIYSVPAIANATNYIWTLPTGASIASGSNTNTIYVNYSMTAVSGNITVKGNNACGDGVISANYPVTVNITPSITINYSPTACSGELATVTPTNGGGNIVPGGTTYSWGLPSVTGGITGATALSGQTSFNQTLTNPTNTTQTASYNVTATTGGCSATTFSVLVTVYPKPTVSGSPSTQPICSGGAISPIVFSETSGILGSINYNWTRIDATSITGIASSGSGTITGNLTNITNSPLTAIFRVIATTQNGCASLPFDVNVVVNPIPTIAASPTSQSICSGNPITNIALSNPNVVPGTITYSWTRTNNNANLTGIPDGSGTSITGSLTNNTNTAITTVFTITALANGCPSSSTTVSVTVDPKPTVAVSTATQTVCGNAPITAINITNPNNVAGTTYTWTRDNNNVSGIIAVGNTGTGATISGNLVNNTNSNQVVIFTITATAGGCASTTTTSTITVWPTPTISITPSTQTKCNGVVITTMNITNPNNVAGTTYTWTRDNPNLTGIATSGSGNVIAGTLSHVLGSTTTQTTTFTITATANGCSSTTTATVTVYAPLVAPVISAAQTVCVFSTPATLTATTPTGGSGVYTYQWQSSPNASGGPWTNVGTNSLSYSPPFITSSANDLYYQLVVTNLCGTVTSNTIWVEVITNVGFTFDLSNTPSGSLCPGSSFTPNISAFHLPTSYVRYVWSTNAAYIAPSTGGPVGATTFFGLVSSADIGPLTTINNTNATVVTQITITPNVYNSSNNNFICSATPSIVNVTIYPKPTATATVLSSTICNVSSASIVAKGNITDAATTFGWTRSVNANVTSSQASGTSAAIAAGGTFTIPDVLTNNTASNQTVTYTITPTSNGCSGTPITVIITVVPSVTAGSIGAVQTICNGATPSSLTSITAGSGSGTISYEWQTNASGSYVTIGGAIGATYSPPALTSTTSYQRRTVSVSGGATCYSAYTTPVTITVNTVVAAGAIGTAQTICNGATPSTLTSVTNGTGSGTITYEWQTNASGSYVTIGGAIAATYSPPALTTTTSYQRRTVSVSGGTTCYSAYTTPLTITVNAVVTAGEIGIAETICNGFTPSTLTSTTVGSGSGTISYEWQTNASGSYVTIGGATGATYSPPSLTATASYQRRTVSVSGGTTCYSAYTTPVTITVISAITSGTISGNRTVCSGGDPVAFTETIPATGTGITYQWQYSLTGLPGSWTDVFGATSATYDAPGPITQITYFQRVVKASANGTECSATSNFVVVFVNEVTASVVAGDQTLCNTVDPAAFTVVTPATGTVAPTYQWQSSTTGCSGPWNPIVSATNATYDPPPTNAQTTYFQVVVTSTLNGVSCSQVSNCLTVISLSKSWNGSISTDWNTPANWTPNGIPDATNCVVIPNTTNKPIINGINYTAYAYSLTVLSGGQLLVQPLTNTTLAVTDIVNVNSGGTLTFEDSSSLVQTNNVTNIGNIIYKRNTTKITKMDYTYWATPVLPFTLGGVSPNTSGDKMYSYDYGIDDWKQESPATSMVPGVGYIIRGPQNYVPPMPPSTYEASFVGVPNNGHYEITGVIPDRSYLLGNPYPSALDADTFLDANQNVLDGTLYFWTHNTPIAVGTPDPGSGLYAYSGNDYASYNRTGGVSTAEPAPSSIPPFTGLNDNIPSGKIASGQGFFGGSKVSLLSNPKIVYDNAMRVGVSTITGNNSQFFRTKTPKSIEKHRIWLNLTNIQGAFKQTLVGYVTDATNGYEDRFDGESYDGNDFLDFYSVNQEKNLTIQGRALPFDVNDEIPLGYRVALDGTFTIKIGKTDGLLDNQTVFLEDKLTNSVFNLKEGNYTFTTAAGTFDDRFVLIYTDKTLGKEELELNDGITVLYSNNYKTLIIRNNVKDATVNSVSLYNMAGQNIANWDVKGREQTSIQIPIKSLPSEIYIVKVKTTKGESSKKIIIK